MDRHQFLNLLGVHPMDLLGQKILDLSDSEFKYLEPQVNPEEDKIIGVDSDGYWTVQKACRPRRRLGMLPPKEERFTLE